MNHAHRHDTNRGKGLTALLAFLVAAVLGLFALSSQVSEIDHAEVELLFREMGNLDTRINHDTLRLRHRQLLHFDSITAAASRVDELIQDLAPPFRKLGVTDDLAQLEAAWRLKAQELELFKQHNSVLSNSYFHFIALTTSLEDDIYRRDFKPPSTRFYSVTRDTLVFLNQKESGNLLALRAALGQLRGEIPQWPAETHASLDLLVRHGEQLLNLHPQVMALLDRMGESEFSQRIDSTYRAYNSRYGVVAERSTLFRVLLAFLALGLALTMLYTLLRLQRTVQEVARSHQLLDNIADNLGEGILAFDGDGRLSFLNRRAEILLGEEEAQLKGLPAQQVLFRGESAHPEASPLLSALTDRQPFTGEEWIPGRGGERFPAALLGGVLPNLSEDDEGTQGPGYVLSFRDMSELRQAEARLHLAGRVFDNLAEAMTITGPDGRIQWVNPAFSHVTGFSEEEAVGHTPGELLSSGQHDRAFYQTMWQALRQNGTWQGEVINRRKSGETYPEWLSITVVRDGKGNVVQYIGLFSDISERKEREAYIHHLAFHDPLTGLANRLLFNDRLDNTIRQAHRNRRPLAVLMLDLDRFKAINDSLGHAAGDQLLKIVASRLQSTLREGDTLARLGGDEFALLMPEIRSHADAAAVAAKMLAQMEASITVDQHEIFTSTSIGIAVYPADGETSQMLLRNADVALYAAKDAGRSVFRFYVQSHSEHSLEQLELESALRHALPRGELRLHYQLQVDCQSGRPTGVEALLRWEHPTRGMIQPDHFISMAENIGVVTTIGKWCIEEACRQMAQWRRDGVDIPRVAVNVSARQLKEDDFVDIVLRAVAEAGIPASCLELELTESLLSDDAEQTIRIFELLRAGGISVAIDDFGTGFSSLSYLARFPVDVVKIDRSFVHGLERDPDARAVVQAIILLAHGLHMEVIAEGVEERRERDVLAQLHCDTLQGFLYARPCPAGEIDLQGVETA